MTSSVVFNGQILRLPSAAGFVNTSGAESPVVTPSQRIAVVGVADSGANGVKEFSSPQAMRDEYVSGDLANAAEIWARPSRDNRVQGTAQRIVAYKINAGTKATLTLNRSGNASIVLTARKPGVAGNNVSATLTAPAADTRKIVLKYYQAGKTVTETSPELGAAKFTVNYVGAGTAATMTITSTALTTTVTAGPGGEDLNLSFAAYPTVSSLFYAINAAAGGGVYTVAALVADAVSLASADLDRVAGVDVRTAPYSVRAVNSDLVAWLNVNSSLVTAARDTGTGGDQAPDVLSERFLASGARGTAVNADWDTAFTAIQDYNWSILVPLCSENPPAADGTFTFAYVHAAADTFAFTRSQLGLDCQAYIGAGGNAAFLKTTAQALNNEHTQVFAGRLKRLVGPSRTQTTLKDWSLALAAACMRCGLPQGEALVWKYPDTIGIETDYAQTLAERGDLRSYGVNTISEDKVRGGYRFDSDITAYTRSQNNALSEGAMVHSWKRINFDVLTRMAFFVIGTRQSVVRLSEVLGQLESALKVYGPEDRGGNGALTDSIDTDGTVHPAYGELRVTVGSQEYGDPSDVMRVFYTIYLAPNVNFLLSTAFVIPASLQITQ